MRRVRTREIQLRGFFSDISLGICSKIKYCKVASSNTFRLEAHAGFFRLLMKGIFVPYELLPFDEKLIF